MKLANEYALVMAHAIASHHPPSSDYAKPEFWVDNMLVGLGAMARHRIGNDPTVITRTATMPVEGEVIPPAPKPQPKVLPPEDPTDIGGRDKADLIREAKGKGYNGHACTTCGNFTLVTNGTCFKCDTCGSTSGCS